MTLKVPESRLLDDLLQTVYIPRKLQGATKSTLGKYRYSIGHFKKYLGHPPTLDDLDDEVITSFLHWLVGKGLSPHTVNSYGAKIAALWDFLGRKRIAHERPSITYVRAPKRKPVGWSREQVQQLFEACGQQQGVVAGIPAGSWWLGLHLVLWETGERIGAVLSLRWSDFDIASRMLTVPAEVRKGRTEDKSSRLSQETADFLMRMREPERNLIFPIDFDRSTLWNRYARIIEYAGLPLTRKHKFHCVRKTAGSEVRAAGGDATAFLGHAMAETTAFYMVPEIVSPESAADLLYRPYPLKAGAGES